MNMVVPDDYEFLQPYFPAIRHLRSIAKQSSGLGVVVLRIVIDEFGKPKLWTMPELTRLVPRATADLALADLVKQLTES
jgi:hypothetical protein